MKGGNHIKTFFDKKHFKTLNSKLEYVPFKKFISEVHKRVSERIILNNEPYILPFKLGEIYIEKEKKQKGIMSTHSKIISNDFEYNEHSFGFVYKIHLDKKLNVFFYSNYLRSVYNLLPSYKGIKLINYPAYAFSASREDLKRPLARKIKNKEFL